MIRRHLPMSLAFLPFAAVMAASVSSPAAAQDDGEPTAEDPNVVYEPALYEGMDYRMIGPYRGGRVTAVDGRPGRPETFFMGSTGGGVWRTTDGGEIWEPLTDDDFEVASVGAVEVADADPSVVYAGTGSACLRGNVSIGRGVYRSTDGGESWRFAGLPEAGQIGDVITHPGDADLVYAAVLGDPFGPNAQRGVFRSTDGGGSWERVLFVSDSTGAVDLSMNPDNPREIYAATWRVERKPWTLIDGAREGGIWKTTDGGESWTKLDGGLPDGLVGRIGVSVSPADPDRVWALVTAPKGEGGLYRSDDRGESWTLVSDDRDLLQRGWYYSHVVADPGDPNTVYVLNVGMHRSVDGGRTFERIRVPHGDVHDLWIDPADSDRMVVGNDGGAQVSVDGGASWTTMLNQPTAEFYRVEVDGRFPYRVYGAQQDNSTISIPAWGEDGLTPQQRWYSVGGGESGHIAVHPEDPDLVYAGSYIGRIDRFDRETGHRRNVILYPQMGDGVAPRDMEYRFQWNAPIEISPHDPHRLYHASNYVHRSADGGMTWETISPDLTTDDESQQGLPGGPIQHDHTGVEVYNTVFALTLSPHEPGVLWAGTDDGRVHLSRDDGESWTEITPEGMPAGGTVNAIEVSPHRAGEAYLAVYRYREADYAPYVFRTTDHGASWTLLTDGENGIPSDHFVRVVREDPERDGLLYAGTEFGMYVSFDEGARWQSLQLDLPVTPITDLAVHRGDLVVATQGRSFWVLDDLSPLRQLTDEVAASDAHLFEPQAAYRVDDGGFSGPRAPDPRPDGARLHYWLAETPDAPVTLEVLDAGGTVVRAFTSDSAEAEARDLEALPSEPGMHRFTWDLTYPGPDVVEDAVMSLATTGGFPAPPGEYRVRLTVGDVVQTRPLEVRKDPRLEAITQEDLRAQFELTRRVRDALTEVHDGIRRLRSAREQVGEVADRVEEAGYDAAFVDAVRSSADSLASTLTAIEEGLMQTKNESGQDPLNFPPRLDNQVAYLYTHLLEADGRPTEGSRRRFRDLQEELADPLGRLGETLERDLAAFNARLEEEDVPHVIVPTE